MCGIAGLQIIDPGLRPRLGELLVPMLGMLAGRGPDSTGVAIYGAGAPPGATKYEAVCNSLFTRMRSVSGTVTFRQVSTTRNIVSPRWINDSAPC